MKIGKDTVVMGHVPPTLEAGEGAVIIGPTDAMGNVNLTSPMAVGRNAQAGPGSIAIGANASAGVSLEDLTARLSQAGLPANKIQELIRAVETDSGNGIVPSAKAGQTGNWFTRMARDIGVASNVLDIIRPFLGS